MAQRIKPPADFNAATLNLEWPSGLDEETLTIIGHAINVYELKSCHAVMANAISTSEFNTRRAILDRARRQIRRARCLTESSS